MKLTASQVAYQVGVSVYTIKRWYKWYEQEDVKKLNELTKQGMPTLPQYETIGATKWRYWNEEDIKQLKKFKEWVPHTRAGVMGDLNKKEDK